MLSKSDLAKRVAEQTGMSQSKAGQMLNYVFDTISETLSKGEEVRISGFGTFRVGQRGERKGRNPRTGEAITIPASKRPTFSPSSTLTSSVQGKGG